MKRLALLVLMILSARSLPAQSSWLRLEDVLKSVTDQYPPLLAALRDRVIADGDLTIAEGKFDLNVKGGFEGDYLTYYRNDLYRLGVEQPLEFQGMSLQGGYGLGRGSFATYDGKLQTDSAGEYKMGLKMPLFRDRVIDARRADLRKAWLGRRIADLGVAQQRLAITQLATRRYYDWVAVGIRYRITRDVLLAAEQRDKQLKEAAGLGQIPQIDVTDNQRAILTRRALWIEAQRGLEAASIELSLFWRNQNGEPVLPRPEQLPPAFPAAVEVSESRLLEDIERALLLRPDAERIKVQKGQIDIDRKLARNQRLPGLDFSVNYTRESGERLVRRGTDELAATLTFDLPLQRRAAKGKESVATAKWEQLDLRERFTRDQIAAEVRDAHSALRAAYQKSKVLREELEVARELEAAERVRFELGEGTLFLVNLREQATFDTALREVAATNEYFRARAQYEYALGTKMEEN